MQNGEIKIIEDSVSSIDNEVKSNDNLLKNSKKIYAELKEICEKNDSNYMEVVLFSNGKAGILCGNNSMYITNENELLEYLDETDLMSYKNKILSLKRNEVLAETYTIKYQDRMKKGVSKIGGSPDISNKFSDFRWPKTSDGEYLSFVCQINLSEIKDINDYGLLKGMLYFFYDRESGESRVIYSNDDSSFETIVNNDVSEIYKTVTLLFKKSLSFPLWDENGELGSMTEDESESYNDMAGCVGKIKMFGYADYLEDDMEKSEDYTDMILLAQISSLIESGMEWGYDGCIYFWINKEDLRNMNFSNIRSVMQSYSY